MYNGGNYSNHLHLFQDPVLFERCITNLYKAYPQLKHLKVATTDIPVTGATTSIKAIPVNTITTKILLKNDDIAKKNFKNTLLHEINHYIEAVERYDRKSRGENPTKVSKNKYRNNLGEIISNETKINSNLTQEELNSIMIPEQAKSNPKYKNIREKLLQSNQKDLYIKTGADTNDGQINNDISKHKIKNIEKNTRQNHQSSSLENYKYDSEELDNSSFSYAANIKRYDDLSKTNYIEYFRKDDGFQDPIYYLRDV